ncbi:Hypothetical_protein [Hexamita inflata]|uniref:Hypothetical_protein n=1 Tax=Hexamita inflata TaxID=28002 RepID=A0AA86P3T6_9EUKA|nr:Hypothetical protein HINF_LOCUS18921 [Hexamita inflata]
MNTIEICTCSCMTPVVVVCINYYHQHLYSKAVHIVPVYMIQRNQLIVYVIILLQPGIKSSYREAQQTNKSVFSYCRLSKIVLTPKLGQSTRSLNVFKIRLQTKSDERYWITHYSKTQNLICHYNQGGQTYYHFNYHLTK